MKTNTLNLENYGVQEMNEKEMKEIQGGIGLLVFAAAALVAAAVGAIHDYMHSSDEPCDTPADTSCPFD